jgi:predicted metal-dependent hydrolase
MSETTSPEVPGPTWTLEQITTCCQGNPHPMALKGITFFNAHKYFEAHEELELAWREERGAIRDLYRGILQVGLGYYHILRGNFPGARKMFMRCRGWLAPYPPACRGIDVETLRQDFTRAEVELLRLGPEHIGEFNQILMRPVLFTYIDSEPLEDIDG